MPYRKKPERREGEALGEARREPARLVPRSPNGPRRLRDQRLGPARALPPPRAGASPVVAGPDDGDSRSCSTRGSSANREGALAVSRRRAREASPRQVEEYPEGNRPGRN